MKKRIFHIDNERLIMPVSNRVPCAFIALALVMLFTIPVQAQIVSNAPARLDPNSVIDGRNLDIDPKIATDGKGNWVAVWVNGEESGPGGFPPFDFDIHISTSTNNGGTWTPPTSLRSNDALFGIWDYQPNITTDGNGTWMIVWSSLAFDIFTATSTDNGATWTDPIIPNFNSQTDFLLL